MPTYTVRMVIQWVPRPDQEKKFLYEERITAWNTDSLDAAIDEAEKEASEYAEEGSQVLDLFQGYWLFDEVNLIPQGTEVFSLLRESDLEPSDYLDSFFDTGTEHQGVYSKAPEPEEQNMPVDATARSSLVEPESPAPPHHL